MSRVSTRKTHRVMKYKVNKSGDKSSSARRLEEISLPASKLKFCPEQLQNLNFILRQKVEQHLESEDGGRILAKSVAERFIQRLVCGIGMLDERFCSKYLIQLNDHNTISETTTYLLRIDALSTPVLYEGDPEPRYELMEEEEAHAGYCKIKLHEAMMKHWEEFTNSSGYLRRDKLQSKVVELLAKSAGNSEQISSGDIDESILCGSPGKIVDAATLNKILHVKTEKHIYYGAGASSVNYPNPKDFRIAIVDEPDGIRIHLEFLSPALSHISLNVRLLVGIGVDYWATSTDFPFRISLGHTDCLLYHVASRTGMYLVGFGVHSSAWQIRFPAAENVILNHYSPESTTRTVLQVMYLILSELKAFYENRKQIQNNILTHHLLLTALFYELENDKSHPTNTIIYWSPLYLSTIVLKILDKLVLALQKEHCPDYFFPAANLIRNPGHLCENDYLAESHKVQHYIAKLFDESLLPSLVNNDDYTKMISSIKVETMLLVKWKEVVDKMSPPRTTRARRMSLGFATNGREAVFTQYTYRQMEYIGLLLKNVLSVRENVWKNDRNGWIGLKRYQDHPIEDIVYLLVMILEQARDTYITRSSDAKIKEKLRLNFHLSINKLVHLVRKDIDINLDVIQDDVQMVKIILKWLYKSMDHSRKYLAPILRPYLNLIFTSSHAISWHIEHLKISPGQDELKSLGIFAQLINRGKLSPAHGLVDAYNKKWIWAKDMLKLLENGTLRLILIPERNKVCRHTLSATTCKRDLFKGKTDGKLRRSISFSTRSYFDTLLYKEENLQTSNVPIHDILKKRSLMTYTLKAMYRNGDHRCAGDVFRTLFSMHRINVLHEIATVLHQEDRAELLDYIQTLLEDKERNRTDKVWSKTLPHPQKGVLPSDNFPKEKYTAIEESAGIKIRGKKLTDIEHEEMTKLIEKLNGKDSLIGSCRAARIKDNRITMYSEDNFHVENAKYNTQH